MTYHGDLFIVLPTVEADSIDACVTDPPYGIGFMGKEWDSFSPVVAQRKSGLRQLDKSPRWREGDRRLINPNLKGRTVNGAISSSQIEYDRSLTGQRGFQAWTEQWAREVFRVLKPGAHLLVCGAPRSFHRMTSGLEDAGLEIRDCLSWLYGQGFPKSLNIGNGQGTALKPAWEPIILARKPMKLGVAKNVERHGTGALNIDACRVGDTRPAMLIVAGGKTREFLRAEGRTNAGVIDKGRWPSNVLLDEESAELLDAQTGELSGGSWPSTRGASKFQDIYNGGFSGQIELPQRDANMGGASRFYYVAKPSREERDFGCYSITARQRDESRKEGNPGGENPRNRGLQPRSNFHPTVKPVELMRWLVRLVAPIGSTVLDPFMGSGTTGMACRYEQCKFIGIEREAEYLEIATKRIEAVCPLFSLEAPPDEPTELD